MLLINSIILCLCAWAIAKVYNRFIRLAKINSYRFQLFSLRDRLTFLVLEKKVDISDKQYITLLKLLNSSIKVFDENFSFSGLFTFFSRLASNRNLTRDIDDMIKQLKSHNNKELAFIACEYFELNCQVFRKYSRRTPLSFFMMLLSFIAKSFIAYEIKRNIELTEKIDASLENNWSQLRSVCT